jgi:hypothetical protein
LLTVESLVVIVICNSDGTGYNTYGTGSQYSEVGYWILRRDTKLQILVSQLDTEKKFKFQTLVYFFVSKLPQNG